MMRGRRCPAGLQPETVTRGSGQQPSDDPAPAANLLDITRLEPFPYLSEMNRGGDTEPTLKG